MSDTQLELGTGYPDAHDQAPVPALEPWPERFSQTFMSIENNCPRGAYLYLKYMGRVKSHEMDRGTLAHACSERLMLDMIVQGEESIVAKRAGDGNVPTERAEEALSMMTAALVEEVRREFGDRIHISHEEADIARVCTFHTALAIDVDPENVLGLETKFVVDLDAGVEVSVKADLIHHAPRPENGAFVDDYKTSLYAPAADEWSAFQVKLGALALVFGQPVEMVPCPRCSATGIVPIGEQTPELYVNQRCPMCAGRCKIEVRQDRRGGHLAWVEGREVYPRKEIGRDGKMLMNRERWTRLELDEFKQDLERAAERILERMSKPEAKWPARKGSWCSRCAAPHECPIPAEERDHLGAVRDREHASLLWEWTLAMKQRVAVAEKAVKEWAKVSEQDVRVGDESYGWTTTFTRSVKRKGKTADWDGFEAAVERSLDTGEEFDLRDWIKDNTRREFKKVATPDNGVNGDGRAQPADAGGSGAEGGGDADADRKWGVDAPW